MILTFDGDIYFNNTAIKENIRWFCCTSHSLNTEATLPQSTNSKPKAISEYSTDSGGFAVLEVLILG